MIEHEVAFYDFCAILIEEKSLLVVDSEEVVFLLLLGLRLLNVSLDLVARIFEPRWDVSRCQLHFLTNRVLLLLCYEMLQLGFLVDFILCF